MNQINTSLAKYMCQLAAISYEIAYTHLPKILKVLYKD